MPPAPANCSQCGPPLRPTETRGLCPVCLLETSLSFDDNDAESDASFDLTGLEGN